MFFNRKRQKIQSWEAKKAKRQRLGDSAGPRVVGAHTGSALGPPGLRPRPKDTGN